MLSRVCHNFSLRGGQGGGKLQDGLCCIPQLYKLCPLNMLVPQFAAKFKHHSSESQQMITLNSSIPSKVLIFFPRCFSEVFGRHPACFLAHGTHGFMLELKGFKLTVSGSTAQGCKLWHSLQLKRIFKVSKNLTSGQNASWDMNFM